MSPSASLRVHVVARLIEAGVTHAFVYPGTSELSLCSAMSEAGIVVMNTRGDKEAVFMAAGMNRAGAHQAVALVHGARGLTNALGAVADVRRSEVRLICLVGMASRESARFLPPHAEPDLIDTSAGFAVGGYDLSAHEGQEALECIDRALDRAALAPYGPVLIGLPADMTADERAIDAQHARRAQSSGPNKGTGTSAAQDITAAVRLLDKSARPLILVDDYLFSERDAMEKLASFSSALGAPVLQLAYRRGPMLFQQATSATVPNFVGLLDPSSASHRKLLDQCDLLVTLEDRNLYPRVSGALPMVQKLAVTSHESRTRKNGYLSDDDVLLGGSVIDALVLLTNEQCPRPGHRWYDMTSLQLDPRASSIDGRQLVSAFGRAIPTEAGPVQLVDDSQMFGGLIAENYDLMPTGIRVSGSHGGFVGGGLASAVGASVDSEGLTICLLGDQGLTNGIQGLGLAADLDTALAIIVCNNGASVSLKKQWKADGLPGGPFVLDNPGSMNYTAIANGFGVRAATIRYQNADRDLRGTQQRLAEELQRTVRERRPVLIELLLPGDEQFWHGIWRTQGNEQSSAES